MGEKPTILVQKLFSLSALWQVFQNGESDEKDSSNERTKVDNTTGSPVVKFTCSDSEL